MTDEKKRGGGPQTPEGKARSSQNSTKHGVLAQTLVLPDECREDYDAVEVGWRGEFKPAGYQEERLVEILVRSDWFFQRAEQRWMAAEAAEEEQHQLELLQRYKTTAERSFYRAWAALRGLKKDFMKLDDRDRKWEFDYKRLQLKLDAQGGAEKAPKGMRQKPKKDTLQVMEQWAEIRTLEDGRVETELFPSNEKLLKEVEKRGREPELVYRRLFFVGVVPEMYRWTTTDPTIRQWGGMGTQRMTMERWRAQIAREMISAQGHLLPCGGNLPRPKERGGCECKVCVGNDWMLKAAGLG